MPAVLDQRYCEMGFSAAVTAVSGGPWGVLWALVALCEGRPHGCRDGGGVGWSYGDSLGPCRGTVVFYGAGGAVRMLWCPMGWSLYGCGGVLRGRGGCVVLWGAMGQKEPYGADQFFGAEEHRGAAQEIYGAGNGAAPEALRAPIAQLGAIIRVH